MASQRIVATDKFVQICGIIQGAFSEISVHGIPVKVNDWKKTIENRLSKPGKNYSIKFESFEPLGSQIIGTLLRYKDHASIYFAANQPLYWQRYIAAKELAHLLIDTPEEYTHSPSGLVSQLIAGIPLGLLRQDHYSRGEEAYQSEKLACVAAIEMLLPWKFRGDFNRLVEKGLNPLEISVEFKVPSHIISNLLHPNYRTLSDIANTAATKAPAES
jgi:Zn-dependent peptidase ImmA (M78 family)